MELPYIVLSNGGDHCLACIIGILLSVYSINVEVKKKNNPKYVAMCDFNNSMSCSRVLTSEYSTGFGLTRYLVGKESMLNVPNCMLGLTFYTAQLLLGLMSAEWTYCLLYYASVISCLSSLYLAYILAFVLKDCCIVCIATYVINLSLMYLNYHRYVFSYAI